MPSANNYLDRPILTHRRTRVRVFKAPRPGYRFVVSRPGDSCKWWQFKK